MGSCICVHTYHIITPIPTYNYFNTCNIYMSMYMYAYEPVITVIPVINICACIPVITVIHVIYL